MRTVVRLGAPTEADSLTRVMDAPADVYPQLLAAQAEGTCLLLVAEVGGRVVGTGLLRWAPRDTAVAEQWPGLPELSNLQVHPDERGSGHGTALVEDACARATAAGHERIGIGVGENAPDAARLYLRLDFAETGLAYSDRYTWTDADGVDHDAEDAVRHLVRRLV
ncbi:MAG: putative acetyltransferase [Klenkia sp.]|nr:putative acetyltransferase [Klenkia sp.]